MKLYLNLLPDAARQTAASGSMYRWLALLLELALLAVLLLAVLALAVRLQQQRQVYEERWQPVLVQVQHYQAEADSRSEAARTVQRHMASLLHWPALLTVLAETKPPGVVVQQLHQEGERISVTVCSREAGAVQQWQQRLQRSEWISKASLDKMRRQTQGVTEAEIQLVISHEVKNDISETP